jgi:hypothetical protein
MIAALTTRRRSRILEHALRQIARRAAALIFNKKYPPTFVDGRRHNIAVSELALLTPKRLLASPARPLLFP